MAGIDAFMQQLSASAAPDATRPARSLAERWADVTARAIPWRPPAVPLLVVVPHPDDEVLGTGGLIAHQRARGVEVTVLAVTDGEAAYQDRDLRVDLASCRRREQLDALDELGVDAGSVVRLALPDGRVTDHEEAIAEVVADLAPPGALVVAPSPLDHHCDHEAVGRAATRAARRRELPVVHSLFWAWHHRTPGELVGLSMLALPLDAELRRRRRAALARHRSQITDDLGTPLLSTADLVPAGWEREYYLAPGR